MTCSCDTGGVGPREWVIVVSAALLYITALPLAMLLKPTVKCATD